MKKLVGMFLLVVGIVVIDQITKNSIVANFKLGESLPVIDGFFNLTYVRNTGAAFGFGAGYSDWFRISIFLALPTIACGWLVWAIWNEHKKNFLMCLAYTLVLGGAIGNLIDRYTLKFVIDFFDFYVGNYHFAAFNIADSAITIAAFLIIIDYFVNREKQVK